MSGSVGGIGDYGFMTQLIGDSASVRSRLDQLTQQESTGRVAETYGGLGASARITLDIRPEMAHQQTWQNNIDAATGRMQVTQTAMTQIQQIASNLYSQLDNLNGLSSQEVDSVAASARQALQQVAGLLDTTDGGVYVFAGQDTANPPVPNPDQILSSGFYTQINAVVAGLGASATPVTSATLAIASSNAAGTSPFSASLSQPAGAIPNATAQVGEGQQQTVGLLASANSFVTSTGSSTTGSYMRDLLRALATIGSLSSNQTSAGGFQGLVQDTQTSLHGAIAAMAEDAGVLGNAQSTMADTKSQLTDTATALTSQVSNVEDADAAATLTQISLTQTQLQASYQLIAGMSQLSLVRYLPTS